jgi:hypothetical protein
VAKIIFDAAKKIVEENALLGDPTTTPTSTTSTADLKNYFFLSKNNT